MKNKIIITVIILLLALNSKASNITINNITYDADTNFHGLGYSYIANNKQLNLDNYRGESIIASDINLTIKLEGTSLITSESFGIQAADLFIYGEGKLSFNTKYGMQANQINLNYTNISFLGKNDLLFQTNTLYIINSKLTSENNAYFANFINYLEIASSKIEIINSLGILKSNNIIIRQSEVYINIPGAFIHDNDILQIINSNVEIISENNIFKKNNEFVSDKLYLVLNDGVYNYMGDYLNTKYFSLNREYRAGSVNIRSEENENEIIEESPLVSDNDNIDTEKDNIDTEKDNVDTEKDNVDTEKDNVDTENDSIETSDNLDTENEVNENNEEIKETIYNPETLDTIPKSIILVMIVIGMLIISSMVLIGIKNWTN